MVKKAAKIVALITSSNEHEARSASMRLRAFLNKHRLHIKNLRPCWTLGMFDFWAAKARHIWTAEDHKLRLGVKTKAAEKKRLLEMARRKKGKEMKWHPSACVFPINQSDLDAMIEDIKRNGQRVPGKAWKNPTAGDTEGVDGRLRARACEVLDIDFEYEILDLPDDLAVLMLVNSLNGTRRHLNQSQKAMSGAKQLPLFSAAAKQRQLAGKAILPEGEKGQSRDIVAKMLNVSPRLIQEAITVLKKGCDELIEAVESGKRSVSAAAIIAEKLKDDKYQQKLIVEMTDEGFSDAVKNLRLRPNLKGGKKVVGKESEDREHNQEPTKTIANPSGEGEGERTPNSTWALSNHSQKPPVEEPSEDHPDAPESGKGSSAQGPAEPIVDFTSTPQNCAQAQGPERRPCFGHYEISVQCRECTSACMAKTRALNKDCFGCFGELPDECPKCPARQECTAEAQNPSEEPAGRGEETSQEPSIAGPTEEEVLASGESCASPTLSFIDLIETAVCRGDEAEIERVFRAARESVKSIKNSNQWIHEIIDQFAPGSLDYFTVGQGAIRSPFSDEQVFWAPWIGNSDDALETEGTAESVTDESEQPQAQVEKEPADIDLVIRIFRAHYQAHGREYREAFERHIDGYLKTACTVSQLDAILNQWESFTLDPDKPELATLEVLHHPLWRAESLDGG